MPAPIGNTNRRGYKEPEEGKEARHLAALQRKPSITRGKSSSAAVKAHVALDLPNCNCYGHKARGFGTKGTCPICLQENMVLCQDHDHSTNELRLMICMRCNMVLGNANDNAEILDRLADYLDKHETITRI